MYALATDHLLYYKIISEPSGLKLRIWETPDLVPDRHGAYLYVLNLRVADMAEARSILTRHLDLNGGALACDQGELPHKGKIRILAFPTWNSQETP
ncbi:MAG: hypothetical protein ACHWZW_09850 [Spirulina sp.]